MRLDQNIADCPDSAMEKRSNKRGMSFGGVSVQTL